MSIEIALTDAFKHECSVTTHESANGLMNRGDMTKSDSKSNYLWFLFHALCEMQF